MPLTGLSEVLPVPSEDDAADRTSTHSEPGREFLLRDSTGGIGRPNRTHLGGCQPGLAVPLAASPTGTPLVTHVVVVVGPGAEKQVGRVATQAVVAPMTNALAFRNRAECQLPRHAVARLLLAVEGKPPVTVCGRRQLPRPTVLRSVAVHAPPKAIGRWVGPSTVVTGNEWARLPFSMAQATTSLWGEGGPVATAALTVAGRDQAIRLHGPLYPTNGPGGSCP